jgi:tetratricopeptide (TPR) repeat protein
MSTEKDGTAVPPPPDDADDVTHVKSMADFRRASDDDVTNVKPLEQLSGAGALVAPHSGNGTPADAAVAAGAAVGAPGTEDSTVSGPPAADADGTPAEAAPAEESVEEVSDVEVLEEELDEPRSEGTPVLEQALIDAQNLLSADSHYRLIALWERELEALAKGEPDKARTSLYQHEIGELTESRAGDEGAAVKAYAKALQSDAALKPNLWAIGRVFERRQLWPNLQKLLDAEIRFARIPEEKAELLVEKGQLLEERLDDPAGALASYEKALEASPQALSAWMALEKIHTHSGDLAALARVYRGMADATAEPGRKVTMLIDLARLQPQLPDAAGGATAAAQAILREALAVGADSERVLDELERVAEQAGDGDELLAVLDERAQRLAARAAELPIEQRLGQSERLLALRRRQAQLARERGDGERAWGYLTQAVQAAPGEPLGVRELAELAEELGRWDELADLLAARVESAPPSRRLGLRLERAEALRRAGKIADAEAVEAEVARDEPGHLGLLVARERTALVARDWEKLAALWLGEAELANSDGTPTHKPDPQWAATALTQAAAALGDHLGRDAEAHKALGDALALVPHFPPAVAALERLYARTGKHAEHAALLESELSRQPDAARAERLLEALIAAREALDDVAGAATAARRLCELRPEDVRARVRLYELDRAAQRLPEAADDLAALARLLPEERRVDALVERADLLEHRLDQPLAAALAYKEALALRPGDSRAAEAFEALSRRRAQDSGPHEQPSPQAWDDLAAALKREAEASLSPERVAYALLKLGEIHERERKSYADAAAAYRDLLDRAPGNTVALRGLGRAYRALGDDARRAETLEQEADGLAADARSEVLLRLGELCEDALAQPDRADDAFVRALDSGRGSPHAALGKLRTAVRGREPLDVAEALRRLETLVGGDPAARAALTEERSELMRRAGDSEAAGRLAAEAAALDEAARLPWRMRARLHAAASEAAGLGEALEALAQRAGDPVVMSALARRAGLLALASGGRAARVEEAAGRRLRRAHALNPTDAATVVALCDVVPDADALGARAKLAEGAAQIDWLIEHAETLEGAGRLPEAAEVVARALELDGGNLVALELVRRLARAGGDARSFAAATARLAADLRDDERAAALYREAAEAFGRAGDARAAAGAWRAVLDRAPLDGDAFQHARELLRRLYVEERAPGALVELYSHRLEHVHDGDERVRLHLERGELYAGENDAEAAEADLRAALALEPASAEGLRRLATLVAARAGGRDEGVALWSRYLENEQERGRRRHAVLALAELQEQGGRIDEAVHLYQEAIQLAPTPDETRAEHERLAQLLIRQRLWPQAVDELRRLAELAPDGPSRAAVEIRVATLFREGLSDPRAAVEALLRALRAEPLAMEALSRLVPLADAGHVLPIELDEKLERAVDAARASASAAPRSLLPYQALTRLWSWRGDDDARLVAAQAEALVAHRAPPSREHAVEPAKELSSQAWDRIWPESARSVALEVWRAAADAAAVLYGPSLEQIGVGKKERINAKGTPLAWIPVDKIARALCGSQTAYELYAGPRPDTCLSTGLALVLGNAFADKLTPATRFRVARRIALMRERLQPLDAIDAEELSVFFAACARVAELPRPAVLTGVPEARVEERAKVLGKGLARKDRKALAAIGPRLGMLPSPAEFRAAVLEGAARAALAVAGDLPSALAELGLTLDDAGLGEPLLLFAVSEDFRVLRREMGLKG